MHNHVHVGPRVIQRPSHHALYPAILYSCLFFPALPNETPGIRDPRWELQKLFVQYSQREIRSEYNFSIKLRLMKEATDFKRAK